MVWCAYGQVRSVFIALKIEMAHKIDAESPSGKARASACIFLKEDDENAITIEPIDQYNSEQLRQLITPEKGSMMKGVQDPDQPRIFSIECSPTHPSERPAWARIGHHARLSSWPEREFETLGGPACVPRRLSLLPALNGLHDDWRVQNKNKAMTVTVREVDCPKQERRSRFVEHLPNKPDRARWRRMLNLGRRLGQSFGFKMLQ